MVRLTALGVLAFLCTGCRPDTCGDVECVMSHLALTASDGRRIELVELPTELVPLPDAYAPPNSSSPAGLDLLIAPLSAPNFGDPVAMIEAGVAARAPGKGEGALTPSITNQPAALEFLFTETERTLEIDFADPNGEQPAFWISPGSQGRPYRHCIWMMHAERDGLRTGQVVLRARVLANVDFTTAGFWDNACSGVRTPTPVAAGGGAPNGPLVGPAVVTPVNPPLAASGGGSNGSGGSGGAGDEIWTLSRPDGAQARVAMHGGAFSSDGTPQWKVFNNAGNCSFDVAIVGQMSGKAFDFTTHGSGCGGYSVQGTAMGQANGVFGTANQATAAYSETDVTPGGSITLSGTVTAVRVQ